MVPSVIDMLIKSLQLSTLNFKKIRIINFCGEPLYRYQIEAIFSVNQQIIIQNTYGPTECTVSCTMVQLNNNNYKKYCMETVALGNPINGMEIQLSNKDEGEIIINGIQVAEGYWNQKELTTLNFSESNPGFQKKTYRTGDYAIKKNGNIYFSGRKDDQIKSNGYRVELNSINNQISTITNSKVFTLYHKYNLHSFIENPSFKKSDFTLIKSQIKSTLNYYEQPCKIYIVNIIPRNQNDKIDKSSMIQLIELHHENPNFMIII